jgi:hypothetical protein
MARRQICALLLVAAASADVNETAASESRVRALAGQSYDWLADRAPAAKAFAAQAAAQHGPGFIGGALAAVLCMLLGGKKQTKSGARRASMAEAYGVDDAAAAARDAAPAATEEEGKQTRSVLRTVKDVRGGAEIIERGYASIPAPPTARWRGERQGSRRSTGKNRPLPLKPTLPRVLSRANASVVDEE